MNRSALTPPPEIAFQRDIPVCSPTNWALARGRGPDGNDVETLPITSPLPFTVGRKPGCSIQLNNKTVSGVHAELRVHKEGLWLRDLRSTNGTFVNGIRIEEPARLVENDLVQFAECAFRIQCVHRNENSQTQAEDVCDQAFALMQFDRLMVDRLVTPFYQPIISFEDNATVGYEVLARSQLFGLETPAAMFGAAARLNMEVELSRMLRWEGVRQSVSLAPQTSLFVNTHPLEIRQDGLLSSLETLRGLAPNLSIILEVHEGAITEPREMQVLKAQLAAIDIGLAYDDFGAGQTRLGELVEAPPHYLKFDISMIRGIDTASPERQRMLESLIRIVLDLGVNPLAEGIEREEEAAVCKQMGFKTAQGYLFGRPAGVEQFMPVE